MGMPFMRAASKIVVPWGTDTAVPSIVSCTCFTGLGFAGAVSALITFSRLAEADSSGAMTAHQVIFDDAGEMFHDRGDGDRHNLTESADRSLLHRGRKLVEKLHVLIGASAFGPAFHHLDHFLRSHAARNAFAAGFVAIESRRVESHVEHATAFGAHHDRARTDHRACGSDGVPIERKVRHGCRQISRRRSRGCESQHLLAAGNAPGILEDQLAVSGSHGNFEDAGANHVAADAYELHPG